MIPIPLTKVREAFDRISPFMDPKSSIDEVTLRRTKIEVQKEKGADPFWGAMTLGNIALLEWNEPEFDAQYMNALRLNNGAEAFANFAMALQVFGRFVDASKYAQMASELMPTDLSLLREAIMYTYNAGQFAQAAVLSEQYNKRSPTEPYANHKGFVAASKLLSEIGLDNAMVVDCNSIAFELLRERKTRFISTVVETDEQDKCIMYSIYLAASVERVDELDRELGERLFDRVPDFDPSKYWVGYSVFMETI